MPPLRRAIRRAAIGAAIGGGVAARRIARRVARRTARRIFRRVAVRTGIVLAAGAGIAAAIKLAAPDVQKIEANTGKKAEDMTEEDLKAAMKRLGIQKLELTPEEQKQVATPPPAQPAGEFECSECHAPVSANDKFCPGCGATLQ
nr:zinc ribbon domain-containing protein [Candidatus Sigynarchaeota archaeon]